MDLFHFLRPQLLLLLIPALLLVVYLWRNPPGQSRWEAVIDPLLLKHLLDGDSARVPRWPLALLGLALTIACLALAGPTWKRLPQAVSSSDAAVVIALDLSLSMLSNDIKPSRIERVQLKIRDILAQRKEGLTALIAYAGDAHVVVPVTDDANTIAAMLPSLRPDIMPKLGSRADLAVELAAQLIKDAGIAEASLLLISDGINARQLSAIEDGLNKGLRLNLLGVGSKEGGPIPLPQGGFLKDRDGDIVVPQFNAQNFRKLAASNGAIFTTLSKDNSDVNLLLNALKTNFKERRVIDRDFDAWQDMGAWLVLAILPFALLAFRRGWLVMLCVATLPISQPADADWRDIFLNADQRGQKALNKGDAANAAELFDNPDWKAVADYEAGEFERAASRFADSNPYNLGNALAKAGKLQEALDAYDKALTQHPENADATFNRALVEKLLQQQEQQEQQQGNNQDSKKDGEQKEQQGNSAPDKEQQDGEQKEQQNQDSQQQNAGGEQQAPEQKPEAESEKQQQQSGEQQQSEQDEPKQEQTSPGDQNEQQQAQQKASEKPMSKEEQQALQQWLRKVPDDPGGLLRNKFQHQFEQNRRNDDYYDDSDEIW